MTYCVGWRTSKEVFLIADSAVTSQEPLRGPFSNVGELHVDNRGVRIEERALKLFRWESAALTCAGEAESIYTFVHLFNDALGHGCAAPEALERAATSITDPHAPPRFEGLIATFADGEPRLFTFNKEKDARITEVRGIVHLGIADRDHRGLVEDSIRFVEENYARSDTRLACVLAVCQSFTVNDVILSRGYGGMFSGLFADRDGVHWQPDLGYHWLSPDILRERRSAPCEDIQFIASRAREDTLFVASTMSGGTTAFVSSVEPMESEAIIRKVQALAPGMIESTRSLELDFLTLTTKGRHRTAIVEMRRACERPHLGFRPIGSWDGVGKRSVAFGVSRELYDFLVDDNFPAEKRVYRLFELDEG